MKNISVKNKNRIRGFKPILIISALFAFISFYLLREASVFSIMRPSGFYGHDSLINPFGKITNELFTVFLQIIVQLALTILNLVTLVLILYIVSYVMKTFVALIAIGVRVISKVKYIPFEDVLTSNVLPEKDCACLLTCKNLN